MSPATVTHSSPYRPLRWIGWAAAACFAAYLFGANSAPAATTAATPPTSVVCAP